MYKLVMSKNTLDQQIEQDKMSIMANFLACAPFDGWNERNLKQSAQNSGHDSGYALLLFSGGIDGFTIYFHQKMNEQMTKGFLNNPQPTRISDKIAYLIELKFKAYHPFKEAVRSLLQHNILPQNILQAKTLLWESCDQIWYLAGDQSTDYNYYSKRLLLAGVYSSSLLYWLSDDSENSIETKKFIQRRLQNVMKIGKWKKTTGDFLARIKRIWNNS